jgi:hypothetical protein
MPVGTPRDCFHRYQTDPRFHSLVSMLELIMLKHEDDFTLGEFRDAFTLAAQRREMLRVRPILAPETLEER